MTEAELVPTLRIGVEQQGLWTIVYASGALDSDSYAELEDQLLRLAGEREQVRIGVDMSGLEFCDSSGIACLVRSWRVAHERGGGMVLVRPRKDLERRLMWLGLTDRLTIVDETPRSAGQ